MTGARPLPAIAKEESCPRQHPPASSPPARTTASRVRLLWHPHENALTVSVEDGRLGDRFHLAIAPERALDAFYHPFAYAA